MSLLRTWRHQRDCMHHDPRTGKSYVGVRAIIDERRYYSCTDCGRVWVR